MTESISTFRIGSLRPIAEAGPMETIARYSRMAVVRLRRLPLNLHKLLLVAILLPSVFVVTVTLLSFLPHREGMLSHGQEHAALALVMVAGIVPFSFLMLGIFRRIQGQILMQNRELSRRTREMEALLKVGKAVEESVDLDRVLPAALGAVVAVTNAEAAEAWLVDPAGGGITLAHHGRHSWKSLTSPPVRVIQE